MHTLHTRGSGCGEMPSGVKKVKRKRGKTNSKKNKNENKRGVKKHFHNHVYLGIVKCVIWFVAWK